MPVARRFIAFGEWLPDAPAYNNLGTAHVKNVVPSTDFYRPFNTINPIATGSSASLSSTVRGAITIKDDDGTVQTYAGTHTTLEKLNLSSAASWDDKTNSTFTTGYSGTGQDRWDFELWNSDFLVATNGKDAPQKVDPSTTNLFANIGGSPPIAKYVATVGSFLVLANLSTAVDTVKWSAIDNAESWTVGTNQSGEQAIAGGGAIRGIAGGDVGYVFSESKITRMSYEGAPTIFRFDTIHDNVGAVSQGAIARFGASIFFISRTGVKLLENDQLINIGAEKVDRFLAGDIQETFADNISSGVDPKNNLVIWAYPSNTSADGLPDKLLIYNFSTNRFTPVELSTNLILSSFASGLTLEQLDNLSTSVDALQFSLDSPVYAGGAFLFAGFNTSDQIGFFDGDTLEAEIDTVESDIGNGVRAFVTGLRPLVDVSTAEARIETRERQSDSLTTSAYGSMEADGMVPAFNGGRYFKSRVRVPEAASWTYLRGVEFQFRNEGLQ